MSEHTPQELIGAGEKPQTFDQVAITVANPETIRAWSKGEVKNPETINYRTFKPEKGGLFCERIFGPSRDWECSCGKYKRIKHKGVICDRCGVEVTKASVRRERMGHIELAVPVSHIWFYKCMPSRIGLMLDMTARNLERVIYYEDYIVIDPKDTPLEKGQLLPEADYRNAQDEFGEDAFKAGMGAEAIQELLKDIGDNMKDHWIPEIEDQMRSTKSKQNKRKLSKRLRLMQGFLSSGSKPEWMILNVLPVIPPDLRPLVPLDGGRFATSDLNDLYRRVINRNNRLMQLKKLKTPEVIIRNEKRMLQEAVDALFDNGRHGRAVTGAGNRPLKSLSDMLKGKGGRFRQNLLGKRVDYSGRSVIVIGPELKLNQCGLPKKMALVLFEPFIIRVLKNQGYAHTVRAAKKMIERKEPVVWDVLEEVIKGHPVMLNRAPTLHRLSIQAFEPVLIEGNALRVHPLVCTAYNADFDGDQMAVHVPLSVEAQLEARMLMLAPNNIFSPASGKPITTPSQDIILGSYYLTYANSVEEKSINEREFELPLFESIQEIEFAIASRKIFYHTWVRLCNPDYGKDTHYGNKEKRIIVTTAGRVRFNEIWPTEIGYINKNVGKKQISDIIWRCFQIAGKEKTVRTLDSLKNLGFREATRSGASIGIVDMKVPDMKNATIAAAYEQLERVTKQYQAGVITDGERYQKVIDIWTKANDQIQKALYQDLEANTGKISPLFMMVDSGARGNKQQIKQLSGMRGLMAKPSGEIIERPITSNFREGLSVLEYFISTHGARKGLADTALKTADSGYMTRKLVDVAQDVIVTEIDCGTPNGITVEAIYNGDEEVATLASRILGRVSCERIVDPVTREVIVDVNDLISEKQADRIQDLGKETLKIRSVLTCKSQRGCCAKCYGLNLATGRQVKIGEAVGIIAAQSIGEPGTQLTMRTFHVGGTATTTATKADIQAKNEGVVIYSTDLRTVQDKDGNFVALNKNGSVSIRTADGSELESYPIVIGTVIKVPHGKNIAKGATLVTWDPFAVPIVSEKGGKILYRDMIPGITLDTDIDTQTSKPRNVILEHKQDLHPQVVIVNPNNTADVYACYPIPAGASVMVEDGIMITGGETLAKTPRKVSKTKDITGGLPRVAELFEARKPKDACTIARIEGKVEFGEKPVRGKKVIYVVSDDGDREQHLVAPNKHVVVHEGDRIKRGEQLTDGPVSPDEILDVCGPQVLQEHLVNEVQEVYRAQGVEINDKHVEIIIRQMLRKVKITEPGDTDLLWGDQVDRTTFDRINEETLKNGGQPAEGEPMLLGITKASLETESFISAASFQDTTRVLTDAATLGKIDELKGFKENVIMGHLIPAGTGFGQRRNVQVKPSKLVEEEFANDDDDDDFDLDIEESTEK